MPSRSLRSRFSASSRRPAPTCSRSWVQSGPRTTRHSGCSVLAVSFGALATILGPTIQAAGRPGTNAALYWVKAAVTAVAVVAIGVALRIRPVRPPRCSPSR